MHSQIGQSVSTDPLHAAKQWWKELNSTAPSWLSPILGVVSRMSDVGDMKFKALPDPSKYFSNPMDQYSKDADSYRKAIYNSIEPQGLPDNLSFGGVQAKAQSASSGIWAQWDKYLAGIEKNTKKTSDILDSRHTLGGGELARAGVSGSEMARYAAARYQRLYGRG